MTTPPVIAAWSLDLGHQGDEEEDNSLYCQGNQIPHNTILHVECVILVHYSFVESLEQVDDDLVQGQLDHCRRQTELWEDEEQPL